MLRRKRSRPGRLSRISYRSAEQLEARRLLAAVNDTGATPEDMVLTTVNGGDTSLLDNDTTAGATVVSFDSASAQGASVNVNSDGTFSYDPTEAPALRGLNNGEQVVDTFTYSIATAPAPNTNTNTGNAGTSLGTGAGALLGGDLTDPENDGAADANTGYNAIFTGNDEPDFGGGEFAFNIFDNLVGGGNAKWCCNGVGGTTADGNGSFVAAEFDQPYVLTHFTITSSNDSPARDPRVWAIEGSTDGTNWTPIYADNAQGISPFTARNEVVLYKSSDSPIGGANHFENNVAYSHFRYFVDTTDSATQHALNEIEFFGDPVAVETATVSITVTGESFGSDDSVPPGTVNEDTPFTQAAPGVLQNDDPGFTVASNTDSANGAAVTVNADGSYTYDPTAAAPLQALAEGDLLSDTFTYTITDAVAPPAARFIQVIESTDDGDERFHLSELEAFETGVTPNDAGSLSGNTFGGLSTSTNDIANGSAVAYGLGNTATVGTWTDNPGFDQLEHGNENTNPDNVLQGGGAVWSTGNGVAAERPQYTLDLGGTFDIARIRAWPRADGCCTERWDELTFNLYADDGTGNPGELVATIIVADPGGNVPHDITVEPVASGNMDTRTVTVPVTGVNDAPVAVTDVNSLTEAPDAVGPTTVSGNVLANDTDIDSDSSEFMVATTGTVTGTYGSVVFNADGSYTYTLDDSNPDVNALQISESLVDSIAYTMTDTGPNAMTASSTLEITINGENDPPTATDNTATVTEDGPLTDSGNLITDDDGNGVDSDPESDPSAISVVQVGPESDPANDVTGTYGTLDWNADGSYTYTIDNGNAAVQALAVGETVTDSFDYTISDTPPPPFARFVQIIESTDDGNEQFHLSELEVFAVGVAPDNLGGATFGGLTTSTNDIGDGTAVVYGLGNTTTVGTWADAQIQHGNANANPNNVLESGGAVWSTLEDASTERPQYTLDLGGNFDIGRVRAWPRADTCCSERWDDLTINLYADDGTGNPGALVSTTLIADPGGNVPHDVLIAQLPLMSTGTLNVTINGANDTPTAVADTGTAAEKGPAVDINLTGNDTDPDTSDVLTIDSIDTTGTLGTVTVNADDMSVSYDPGGAFDSLPGGATGTDTFSYTVTDSNGGTSTAIVTVTINGENDPPTGVDDTAAADEDGPAVTIDVLANDIDPDVDGTDPDDTLTVTAVDTTGTQGTVTNNGTNVTYDPNGQFESLSAGETATDTFTYTFSDGDNSNVVGYWRMEQDDDPGAGYSVPNEVAGSPLVGTAGSVEPLTGNEFDDPIPQTGAANAAGLNGTPNVNGTIAPYAELYSSSITIELYVRSNEGDARLIDSGFTSGTSGYRLHQPNGVQVQYHVDDGAGGATLVNINSGINLDGDWDHVAWTYDAATGVGTVYLNGAVVGTNDGPDGRGLVHNTTAPITVGEGFDGGGPFSTTTDALFDEVRISDGAKPAGRLLVGTAGPGATSTATVTVTITGQNDPVQNVDAGGPYTISEGDSLTLTGTFDDPDANDNFTFSWDINGDGTFGDADGMNPTTLTFAQLQALGIDDGPATFDVSFRVDDGGAPITSAPVTLTVNNAPPTAEIDGPTTGVLGIPIDFTFTATDPSMADQAADFTFDVDWGDGTTEQFVGSSPLTASHEFQNFGEQTIMLTATDKDGGVSDVTTFVIDIVPVAVVNDDLVATGTQSSDRIIFYPSNGGVRVRYNNVIYPKDGTSFSFGGDLIANGQGGSDQIIVSSGLSIPAQFNGDEGNDYLAGGDADDTMTGGDGNDVILAGEGDNYVDGGDGSDRIEGRAGNDVIFGGSGNDRLNGRDGDDVLDGGDGNDFLFGGLGNDLLAGRAGADTINGHFGNDVILGGSESDQIFGSNDQDLLIGGTGADRIRGDAGDDDIIGGTSDLDDDIEQALDAMMASLGTDLATADSNVDQQVSEWFTSGNDRDGFAPFASDGASDALEGGSGVDEFHAGSDGIRDFRSEDSQFDDSGTTTP